MSELRNYNNLYLDLSQSAYEEMPNSFRKRLIRNKEVADLNYSIGTREGNTEIMEVRTSQTMESYMYIKIKIQETFYRLLRMANFC